MSETDHVYKKKDTISAFVPKLTQFSDVYRNLVGFGEETMIIEHVLSESFFLFKAGLKRLVYNPNAPNL